jgi:Nucleotidyl transferase
VGSLAWGVIESVGNVESAGTHSAAMYRLSHAHAHVRLCIPCRPSHSALRAVAEYTPLLEEPEKSGKPGDPNTVGAIILGGGAGTRLRPLTSRRAKPAVPIGGAYRLIDVPMSNCLNSGINKVYILTQYNSTSLNRHISKTYNVPGVTTRGFVEVLAASQSPGDSNWCGAPRLHMLRASRAPSQRHDRSGSHLASAALGTIA